MSSNTLLLSPRVAWPTLALLAGAIACWIAGVALVGVAWPVGFALATLGAYVAFTPMHEAAHRTIASRRPYTWLNEVAGRIATVPLFGPFIAVRFVHLEHHKHTNEPDADPDHWSGRGPAWLLPLRWLTQDLHYYLVYLRRARPRGERVEVVATFAGFLAIAIALCATGYATEALLGWWLPARLAIGFLAFAFDYLPHRPHTVTAKQDRYRATRAFPGRIRCIASLGQSLHLVHHLYPGVPFYRYGAVWTDRVRDRIDARSRALRWSKRPAPPIGGLARNS